MLIAHRTVRKLRTIHNTKGQMFICDSAWQDFRGIYTVICKFGRPDSAFSQMITRDCAKGNFRANNCAIGDMTSNDRTGG
ncbi:hypothetical protein D3C85_1117730 [compost metagenome]